MNIYPKVLYELGLVEAIEWFIDNFEKDYKVTVQFKHDIADLIIHEDQRGLFYRMTRELLHNAVKHGRADQIKVELNCRNHQINISVTDNGSGFETRDILSKEYKGEGFGLFNIRERLDDIGGKMEIESQPGKGTKATISASG